MVCAPTAGNVAVLLVRLQLMSMLFADQVKQIPSVIHGRGPLLLYQFLLIPYSMLCYGLEVFTLMLSFHALLWTRGGLPFLDLA